MKPNIYLLSIILFFAGFAQAQTTKTVGTGANYPTLQAAFAAINTGAIQGQIILQITGSTTEDGVVPKLLASGIGASNYSSVLIYPTGAFSISTNYNGAVIDLDGADNVTIDGRIGGTGTPNSLTIKGTSTGNGAAGIRFVNSAENNTVKYCNIQACSASSSMGIVAFGGSSTGNGNDNNIVEYCNLTNSGSNRPYNGIVSSGSTGRENNAVIIRNNTIYDTFQTGVSSNGISINTNSVGFTISGNSIYETTAFVTSTGSALTYNGIYVSSTSEHTISGNYIGGKAAMCGGAPWSFTAGNAAYFCGIYAYAGNTATTISNNTIANINYSSKEDNPWDGIFLFTGNFEVSGNTIGATTGTGSITLTTPVPVATTTLASNPGGISTTITVLNGGSGYTTAPIVTFTNPPTGGTAPTATANLSGGVVTSITVNTQGSGYTAAPAVIFNGQSNNYSTSHGMIQNSTGTVNITGNNIGSITTVGSTHYSHGFESIYVRTIAATTTITNNLIGSLSTENSIHVSSEAASSLIKEDVYGIYSAGTGTTTISGNTVANLTNSYKGTNGQTRTRGIQTTSGTNVITNNTVFNVNSACLQTGSGAAASVTGISQTSTNGTTQTVNGNTVYNLRNTTIEARAVQLYGMYYAGPSSGTNSVSGNFVHSLSASSTDIGAVINGIVINSGLVTCANNIINLGGSSLGYLINGIWDGSSAGNNVSFYFNTVYIGGSISSGATSHTAGLWNANNTSTRNYRNNIFYNARSGGSTGKHYAIRIAGTTSLTINYNDYYISGTNGMLGYLATDKSTLALLQAATLQDANSKDINPVFAFPGGTSAINYYPTTLTSLQGTSISDITTDYYGITRALPKIGALEQNENVWQGTTSTDFNTASNWANNAVPASGADIFFATSPGNDCALDENRTIGNITNGSSKNLMVNGKTLTVNGSLSFTSSGKINTSTASSIVKFAGSAAQIIPSSAFVSNTVAGLEISNSSGVTLDGNLTVSSTLTLTSGVLTVGASTLTYSGSSPTSAGGTVDVINASAELIFANATAITLPETFFAGSVNNLTISASGGVTAGSDITVNGVLNLAAANPSATKGLLDMASYTLELKIDATISGNGDVTGIVRRAHAFTSDIPYAFGSQFTTFTFIDEGTRPTWIDLKISIGAVPAWSPWSPLGKVKRYYNIAVSDNSSTAKAVVNMRFLPGELDATNNDESKLVFWHKYTNFNSGNPHEHGKSNQNFDDHTIGVTGIVLSGAATEILSDSEIALAYSTTTKNTWKGEVAGSQTLWEVAGNWTANHVPLSTEDVLIPGGLTYYPSLTTSAIATAKSIEIESGASISANDYDITITGFQGAWINDGSFYPGTGKVTFNHGVQAEIVTISGITNFYDIEAGENTTMQPVAGCILRIAGTGTAYASSIVDFSTIDNTLEWNGTNQTIVNPSGLDGHSGFYNLILSGSGTKTMPVSAMNVRGDFTISGTASATAAGALSVGGNLTIGTGTTLGTGTYSHQIKGNLICDGTLTPGIGSVITMNGSSAQNIQGDAATIALGGLTVSNTHGVTLYNHATTAALNISSGAFTVIAGKSVTATGTTTLGSAECLVLKSDENGTASFIDNGTISGSGTAKAERWMTGDIWHLISPTATGQTALAFIGDAGNGIASNATNYGLSPYLEGNNEWNYFKVSGIVGLLDTIAKGYQVLRATGSGTGNGNADDNGIVSFKGKLAAGDKTIPIAKTSYGWNLIGNPYPCALDIKLFLENLGNIAAIEPSFLGIYVANVTDVTNYGYTPVNSSNGANDLKLASGEAFFVKSKNSTGTINFTAAMKTHASSPFKSSVIQNGFNLVAESASNKMSTSVKYIPQMTAGLDPGWDAGLFYNGEDSPLSLFTRLVEDNGVDFTIQCLPDFDYENLVVPVGIKAKQGATVNFSLADVTVPVGYKVFLEDRVTRKFTRLDEMGSSYSVQINTAGNGTGRFFLHTKQEITGIKDGLSNHIVVIPLPQHNIIRVSGLVNLPAQATVYDMNGRTIAIKNLTGLNENEIPLQGVSNGIYLIKIKSDKETTLSKFSWSL